LIANKNNLHERNNYAGKYVYFVHSFVPVSESIEKVSTFVDFNGQKIHASINFENIIGFQFHPEKSGKCGLKILKNSLTYLSNR
jgi:imidazole glycerol-phosphate synthase subunit HisH